MSRPKPRKWRRAYKALRVLEYLLLRGSPQCVAGGGQLLSCLTELESGFSFEGRDGQDHGANVRLRAAAVKAMILDSEGLAAQRAQLAARAEARAAEAAAPAPGSAGDSPHGYPGSPHFQDGEATGPRAAPASAASAEAASRPAAAAVDGYEGGAERVTPSGEFSPRGAGESKGVTFEANKRQLELLRQLTLLEGNRLCADCGSGSASARPSWASINLGVFICMRCAGVHRGLGVHVSKVRSTTLDTWLPEQVANMARLGNKRANAHFEARLGAGGAPPREEQHDLERFIRDKYVKRAWAGPGPWPPVPADTGVGGPADDSYPASPLTAAAQSLEGPGTPAPSKQRWPRLTAADAANAADAGAVSAAVAGKTSPPPSAPAAAAPSVPAAAAHPAAAAAADWVRFDRQQSERRVPPAGAVSAFVAGQQTDDSSDSDEEEGEEGQEEEEGHAAGGYRAVEGGGGHALPSFGSNAPWDSLAEPRLGVLPWLVRMESARAGTAGPAGQRGLTGGPGGAPPESCRPPGRPADGGDG